MRFITYQSERSLSDLVHRVYQIDGPRAKAAGRDAEAALLEANPGLRDLTKLPAGSVLVVPELPNLKRTRDPQPVGVITGERLDHIRQALDALGAALDASIAAQLEESRNTIELVSSEDLTAVARKDESLKQRLSDIADQAKAQISGSAALLKLYKAVLSLANKDLDELGQRLA